MSHCAYGIGMYGTRVGVLLFSKLLTYDIKATFKSLHDLRILRQTIDHLYIDIWSRIDVAYEANVFVT